MFSCLRRSDRRESDGMGHVLTSKYNCLAQLFDGLCSISFCFLEQFLESTG